MGFFEIFFFQLNIFFIQWKNEKKIETAARLIRFQTIRVVFHQ